MESWLFNKQKWEQWLLVAVLAVGFVCAEDNALQCSPGISTPGVTIPSGDIILAEGSPLEILCILSPDVVEQGFNASNLVFYHTSVRVQPEYVKIVNSSTAQLYVEKPLPMEDMFYCKLSNGTEEKTVCLNKVFVGHPPGDVLNFSCVSYNWDSLNCTWTPPLNYVKTKYTLFYYLPGRAGYKLKYLCPGDTDVKGLNYCYWDVKTPAPYRRPHEYYFFNMTGSNHFANRSSKITFHNYANVIPAKATNLTLLEKTHDRVMIQWSLVTPMMNFPPGVVQKVEYKSQWDAKDYWEVADTSSLNIKNATHTLNITGLKYANCLYDIRVFMKSPLAKGDHLWSQPSSLTIRTKSTAPAAPTADVGSFELTVRLASRDVNIYWQEVPERFHNGDHFFYRVDVEEEGISKIIKSIEVTEAYAEIKDLTLNGYKFKIYSVNQENSSKDHAEIILPSEKTRVAEPSSFSKYAFDNRIYELSWVHPDTLNTITNYTIFWCENSKDHLYQCTGTLNWMYVPKETLMKNITVPDEKIYQFAISANTETERSGMVWASCTVIHNRIRGKMKNIWINRIEPTSMDVRWNLECSYRIKISGFQISYCPIISPHNTSCKEEAKNTIILGNGTTKSGMLTDLIPYTTYMVKVAVIIRNNTLGQWSDSRFNTTLEAAPDTPPQNVKVSNVTNTSMVVEWDPPKAMNGILRKYEIHYNKEVRTLPNNNPSSSNTFDTKVTLTGLESFAVYNVSVSACTVHCSAHSTPKTVTTLIGSPSKIDHYDTQYINTSFVKMTWMVPVQPGGPINSISYLIRRTINDNNETAKFYNVTGNTEYFLSTKDCSSDENSDANYNLKIRAINYYQGEEFASPWSKERSVPCIKVPWENWIWYTLMFLGVFAISVTVSFICRGKQLLEKLKSMKTVEIELPPGLNASDIPNNLDYSMDYWTSPISNASTVQSPPDQERLLREKNEHEQDQDGENSDQRSVSSKGSSGCSSGPNSAPPSLSSGSHVTSDSGTEADQLEDQKTSSLDEVFMSNSEGPSSELRLRNKSLYKDSCSSSSSSLARSSLSLSEVEDNKGYAKHNGRVVDNWRPTPSASGYVSLPPVAVAGPQYKEPISPSKGYVMAGEASPQYCRLDHLPHSNH